VLSKIVGGWEFAGITEFQVGQPLAITQPNMTHGFTETQRPNVIASPTLSSGQTIAHWFNTAAFVEAPAYTLGDAPRFPLHGPGLNNWDLALQRNFIIAEKVKLQFRGEFYNAWNHAQFSNPNGSITSASFGAIGGTSQPGRVTELVLRTYF